MLEDYFAEIGSGRLKTSRFIALWLLLIGILISFALLLGASLGIAERLVGGDIAEAQETLRRALPIPAVIGIVLFFVLFAFAKLNIIAKRARDIGLPGWLTAIIIATLSGAAALATKIGAAGGTGLLLLLILAFVPSDALRRAA